MQDSHNSKSVGLAIFVKTPGRSPIKTRLAAGIGKKNAEEFYKRSVLAVEAVVSMATNDSKISVTPYWAVAESNALSEAHWSGFQTTPQGEGSLGHRLNCVYRELKNHHDIVILIGADSPQMSPQHITKPIEMLSGCSGPTIAIGRAFDGGFYLFGSNSDIPLDIWLKPTYSTNNTCSDLVHVLCSNHLVMELDPLLDVDTVVDLGKLEMELKMQHAKLEPQESLLKWIENLT